MDHMETFMDVNHMLLQDADILEIKYDVLFIEVQIEIRRYLYATPLLPTTEYSIPWSLV